MKDVKACCRRKFIDMYWEMDDIRCWLKEAGNDVTEISAIIDDVNVMLDKLIELTE